MFLVFMLFFILIMSPTFIGKAHEEHKIEKTNYRQWDFKYKKNKDKILSSPEATQKQNQLQTMGSQTSLIINPREILAFEI